MKKILFLILTITHSVYFYGQISHKNKEQGSVYNNEVLLSLEENMVYVKGGAFLMGNESSYSLDFEKPIHEVCVNNFYICKYEVTQKLWTLIMGFNPSHFKDENFPVENVVWDECQEFIQKLNYITGKKYRLPTEAEWEYAARGGNKSLGYKFSGSNIIDEVAWYDDNSNNTTHHVGTKSPNELGLYDMTGNVAEWCQDWYGDYDEHSQTNPTGPSEGKGRICRGGGWSAMMDFCHVTYRSYIKPDFRIHLFGLRLVLSE